MIPNSSFVSAYSRLGSVWRVADELGVSGQTVANRLKIAGHPVNKRWITEADIEVIRNYYARTEPDVFCLDDLAASLGRTKSCVCRTAEQLGLTKQGRPSSAITKARTKAGIKGMWSRKPHPRGMLGKRHSPELKAATSESSKKMWATHKTFGIGLATPGASEDRARKRLITMASKPLSEKQYTRGKGGRRPDIGETFFRSSWEANYARYLNLLVKLGAIERWEYEPETFWFDGVRRGTMSYRPDFRIKHKNDERLEYIELKGWITAKDRTKWRRMAKYHPQIKLTVVAPKEYYAVRKKWASAIPNWEGSKS